MNTKHRAMGKDADISNSGDGGWKLTMDQALQGTSLVINVAFFTSVQVVKDEGSPGPEQM